MSSAAGTLLHLFSVSGAPMVYSCPMARTNIDIDEEVLGVVMRRYGLRTKTEAVDLALRRLAGQPLTIDEALAMHGAHAIDEIPVDRFP